MAGKRKCSINGCEHAHKGHGLCKLHLRRAKAQGETFPEKKRPSCAVDGCKNQHKGHGYCEKHLRRWNKYGDPLIGARGTPVGTLKAFIEAALLVETDDCIPWPYSKQKGYGCLSVNGRTVRAHRYVLQRTTGCSGEGLHACHKPIVCHDPSCINKRHLYWGTPQENYADMDIDKTKAKGERHGMAKLTASQVSKIYADSRPIRPISDDYGVSEQAIRNIKSGKNWGWHTKKLKQEDAILDSQCFT